MWYSISDDLLKTKLHHCWWCGGKARLYFDYGQYYNDDSMQIKCISCSVRTSRILLVPSEVSKIIDDITIIWNSGQVEIPLRLALPSNHYVLERCLIPTKFSYQKSSKMRIIVPNIRNIAYRLRQLLMPVLTENGVIQPHRFHLDEPFFASHTGTTLRQVQAYDHSHTEFCFQSTNSEFHLGDNKTDTVWLRQEPNRPPVFEKVFQILGGDEITE